MTAADLFPALVETTVAGSAAILLVLALRWPLRQAFGAGIAYVAWTLVPLAMLAVLLPAAQSPVSGLPVMAMRMPRGLSASTGAGQAMPDMATWAVIAVAGGALACALWMVVQQRRFIRSLGLLTDRGDGVFVAETTAGLPAVVGLWRPRIVLPADALHRYNADERDLMLAHERAHVARGDLGANAVVAALRCLLWFNPLVHLAATRFRHDQELACDQQVVRRHPDARRAYGEAMLKTQLARGVLPLGCHWAQTHPLRERIEMLKQPLHSVRRRVVGRSVALALLLVTGYAAWAAQPQAASAAAVQPASASDQQAGAIRESRERNPPVYPVDVAKEGVTGRVVLVVDVAADGSVAGAKVERSSGDARLDASALSAVDKWKFRPEVKNGKPVTSQVRVPVDFEMEQGPAVDAAKEAGTTMNGAMPKEAPVRLTQVNATPGASKPITARQAMAATTGNFNTYERMLTSISASWQPPKPAEEGC
ncbi:MAG TPA: TonB family protein [Thermomonas sp.]|nr:TonB family protein [Thermomonas sp.]